ncbi:hypothetical protein [Paraburkholderia rhynchosiae]|uniref:Uncharacterized protein n=1 Tax=Paraburkholderia rhynchosiae TaxID=487049 RepID=A0ABX4UX78_9BURK|nr:hypothetical protein [Paraburkholderia rhynchosiae]PMS24496.1 hypothetical protein C0Z16_30735 [Paraburkholderia rhynchosiae]
MQAKLADIPDDENLSAHGHSTACIWYCAPEQRGFVLLIGARTVVRRETAAIDKKVINVSF